MYSQQILSAQTFNILTHMEIRYIENLPVDRWEEYKNLKIEAIKEDTSAFSYELSEAVVSPDADWKTPLEKLAKGENIMVFAEHEGKLVGMGTTHLFTKERFKHNASLESLYVNSEYRRKGIAEGIEKRQIALISNRPGMKYIFGEIFSSQTASLELHKKLGFEVVGVIPGFMQWEGKYYDSIFIHKKI